MFIFPMYVDFISNENFQMNFIYHSYHFIDTLLHHPAWKILGILAILKCVKPAAVEILFRYTDNAQKAICLTMNSCQPYSVYSAEW